MMKWPDAIKETFQVKNLTFFPLWPPFKWKFFKSRRKKETRHWTEKEIFIFFLKFPVKRDSVHTFFCCFGKQCMHCVHTCTYIVIVFRGTIY
jgi:hypothetical protein